MAILFNWNGTSCLLKTKHKLVVWFAFHGLEKIQLKIFLPARGFSCQDRKKQSLIFAARYFKQISASFFYFINIFVYVFKII